jgi:hypothetical protein
MKIKTLIPFVLATSLAACGSDSDSEATTSEFTQVAELDEVNDAPQVAQAADLKTIISGALNASSDRTDLFVLDITEATDVTLTLTGDEETNFNIGFYDDAFASAPTTTPPVAASGGETSSEELTYSITEAGDYYIGVAVASGDSTSMGNYTLTIDGSAPVDETPSATTYFGPVLVASSSGPVQVEDACNEFTQASYETNILTKPGLIAYFTPGTCEVEGAAAFSLTITGSCLNKEGNTHHYSADADRTLVCPE